MHPATGVALQVAAPRRSGRISPVQQSEERFAKMFHASPAASCMLRLRDGVFLDVNISFLALIGAPRAEVVGPMLEAQGRAAASKLSSDLAALQEEQREMTQRLSVAEARMLQAARLAAVGQLAASIAHEINNPLYAARNSLYLLTTSVAADSQDAAYLDLARDQLARIAGIIERMRSFYRPDRGALAEQDLNHLLEETLALVGINHHDGQIQMVFVPAFDLPPVRCNGDQLRQVFLNIVLNTIDAMPGGGTLTVRTKAESRAALVEIQDSGISIPDELQAHLFEPFWTSKPQGTGLGLSISGHIVTQHGGSIEVESRADEGSLFRIILPYQAAR